MSNPRSDIMGEMQRLPMNHKEGDKGLGIPKGRRTKAVLDPICSKIGISKTNMQEILKMLAIFQAPGKTIFQGSMQEKSFVSSIVASLYKIRKVRAKKLLNRLDTLLIILISSKRRTRVLRVSGDRRQNYPDDGREGTLSAAWYTAAREKGNGTFNLANGDMIHNDIGDPHAEVIILLHIINLISQWLDIGEYIAHELFSWSVSIWASFLLRSDHKVFLTLPPKKLAFPGKVFQPLWLDLVLTKTPRCGVGCLKSLCRLSEVAFRSCD